jgi:hypothetical protein
MEQDLASISFPARTSVALVSLVSKQSNTSSSWKHGFIASVRSRRLAKLGFALIWTLRYLKKLYGNVN